MKEVKPIAFLGDFIDGQWLKSDRPDGEFVDVSPSDLKDQIMKLSYRHDHVATACLAAKKAFKTWSLETPEKRIGLIKKLKEVYAAHAEQIAEVIARDRKSVV